MARRKPKFWIFAKVGTWSQQKLWVWDLKSIVPGAAIEWMEGEPMKDEPMHGGSVYAGVVQSIDEHGMVRITQM